MRFNKHYELEGQHAYLSPSKYHWINYDPEKFDRVFTARIASKRGTELHDLAMRLIRLGVKLPDTAQTMNLYVNDAIGFRMEPEQPLFYSVNAFGTPDAISFREEFLRIHDLKTGKFKASVRQLEVYAALFCLEYAIDPMDIGMEFRIYQNDEVAIYDGDPEEIKRIMDKIVDFDQRIQTLREEAWL